ncbi:formylmethanofuran dehydrogenase subunit C [Caballeronia sp. BR00000012568055]|uniref:formylmethanofuran dehydrogenase subunit C n=1 Tax=Caballeronia sp. BR00000012568055 TaxID=2918761 RepID=UPI0023F9064C|nr:formylmethanofuran dehydrogenase subunit C [Caballeronia sp. BR00000012568055]
MNATTLRIRKPLDFKVDASKLLPAALAVLSSDELTRFALSDANCVLGDLFDIMQADADAPSLTIEGDASWLDHLGAKMNEGTLTVRGNAGDYTGFGMNGGALRVHGDAGIFTACEMQNGRVTIHGNTGDFAAGALPGHMEGMSGGVLTIEGNAGARLADRMRRGTVLVTGNAGDFAASRLIAGTVCIGGKVGAHLGYGMRRGTVLLLQTPPRIPPTFTVGGHGFEVFWRLFTRTLSREIAPFVTLDQRALPVRHAGDLAVDGRGELLIAKS